MRQEVQVYVTIKLKGLSQRFEESDEGDRQIKIKCLQHNPEETKTRYSPEIDPVGKSAFSNRMHIISENIFRKGFEFPPDAKLQR